MYKILDNIEGTIFLWVLCLDLLDVAFLALDVAFLAKFSRLVKICLIELFYHNEFCMAFKIVTLNVEIVSCWYAVFPSNIVSLVVKS